MGRISDKLHHYESLESNEAQLKQKAIRSLRLVCEAIASFICDEIARDRAAKGMKVNWDFTPGDENNVQAYIHVFYPAGWFRDRVNVYNEFITCWPRVTEIAYSHMGLGYDWISLSSVLRSKPNYANPDFCETFKSKNGEAPTSQLIFIDYVVTRAIDGIARFLKNAST